MSQYKCKNLCCFIDFEKALPFKVFKNAEIDDRNVWTIASLYYNKIASVLIDFKLINSKETQTALSARTTRQICVLYFCCFLTCNLKKIMTKAINMASDKLSLIKQLINNLKYVNNTALIALPSEGLECLLDKLYAASVLLTLTYMQENQIYCHYLK